MNTKFQRLTPLFSQRSHFKSIGYARDINNKQISIDAQIQELTNAGCILVYQESDNSGKKKDLNLMQR